MIKGLAFLGSLLQKSCIQERRTCFGKLDLMEYSLLSPIPQSIFSSKCSILLLRYI